MIHDREGRSFTDWEFLKNLSLAISRNQINVVDYIIDQKSDAEDGVDFSTLHSGLRAAIETDQIDILKHLVGRYIKKEKRDDCNFPEGIKNRFRDCISEASSLGRLEMVKFLMEFIMWPIADINMFLAPATSNAIQKDQLQVFHYFRARWNVYRDRKSVV